MDHLVRLFRRETSSTEFVPVIDGLRFLAIMLVVLFHINAYIITKAVGMDFQQTSVLASTNVFGFGYQGVMFFFVISGFILAMPFLRQGLGLTEKKIPFRKYLLRRLTRLEPPYIVSTILLFLLIVVFGKGDHSLNDLLLSLVSSLFYVSNFVYPGELPHINPVAWSLEIEVQYYLIAPFVIAGLCLLKNKVKRRVLIVGLIIIFAIVSWFLETVAKAPVMSLARVLDYFLSGVLLCDLYLLDKEKLKGINNIPVFMVGILVLVGVTVFEHTTSSNLILRIASPFGILLFYLIVFWNSWWTAIFSVRIVTLIGGMCYTIYLLHFAIISIMGRLIAGRFVPGNIYLYFGGQAVFYLFGIAVISSTYFLLIEKPCMKQDWYLTLRSKIKSRLSNYAAARIN